jgi:hypothetical protein
MPRNPNKRRCQTPACRNWAMRGRVHCRPHLDHELGPRGAGAPRGNLNAFKTGANINPFSKPQIRRLAHSLVQDPDHLRDHLVDLVEDIHTRISTQSPARPDTIPPALTATLLINNVTQQLISVLSEEIFAAEMDRILSRTPPAERAALRARLWSIFLPVPPLQRLVELHKHRERKKRQTTRASP